jgi:hypothetical protein
MFGVGTGVVCIAFLQLPAGESARIGIGVSGLALALPTGASIAGSGVGLFVEAFNAITHRDDAMQADDLDDAPPPARPQSVRIEQWAFDGELPNGTPNVKQAVKYELPCSPRQLRDFAQFALTGQSLSADSVKRHAGLGDKVWRRLQTALLDRGHLAWKSARSHTQGVALTRGGVALCKSVLHSPTGGDTW